MLEVFNFYLAYTNGWIPFKIRCTAHWWVLLRDNEDFLGIFLKVAFFLKCVLDTIISTFEGINYAFN